MKHFFMIIALTAGVVFASCSKNDEDEKKSLPQIKSEELRADSPEGTVGIIDGREGIVFDLGEQLGKVIVATMNVGAKSANGGIENYDTTSPRLCDGDLLKFDEAVEAAKNEKWGKGWRMPSCDEMYAVSTRCNPPDWSGLPYYLSKTFENGVTFYLPASGFNHKSIDHNSNIGKACYFWSKDEMDWYWAACVLSLIDSGGDFGGGYINKKFSASKDTQMAVRPFHDMPTE